MPNFAFVSVTFAIHVALALWIGGTLFLGALAAPAIFRGAPSRTAAGEIVGAMVGSFGRVKLVCLVVLILAAWLRFSLWEVWNGASKAKP